MTGFVLMPVLLVLLGSPSHAKLTFDDISTTKPEVQVEIVEAHNEFRLKEPAANMLKMRWNNESAELAAKWAAQCTLEHSRPEARILSDGTICGENIFQGTNLEKWKAAVKSWYDEKKFYHKDSIDWGKVGHFTQLIWNRSNEVGCAVSFCEGTKTPYFFVCLYSPAGNLKGNEPYKKGSHCGDCPNDCIDGLCDNACTYKDKAKCKHQWYCLFPRIVPYCEATCKCGDRIS